MYTKYNYLGATTQSQANILSDIVAILSGQTVKGNLTGHVNLSSAAVGITNGSATVTWAGADNGSVYAQRKNIEVGQGVSGVGIPAGALVASVTNQTGFTLKDGSGNPLNATATNAAAILILDDTTTLPVSTIGSTTKAISTTNTSTTLTITGMCTATLGIVAVGSSIEGYGIPNGTTVSSITNANTLVMSAAATATVSPASIVISPPSTNIVCDTANTSILYDIAPAGWTLWDMYGNAGVANIWIMRAPINDDPTSYKYLSLDVSTDGFIQIGLYESWNNSNHTGGAQAYALGSTFQQRLTKTAAATLAIASSARFAAMQSIVAAGTGGSDCGQWTGVFERTRLTPWDTVANGYPPTVLLNGASIVTGTPTVPRLKNPAGGADLTGVNALIYSAALGGHSATANMVTQSGTLPFLKIPDGLGGFYTPLIDVHVRRTTSGVQFLGGSVSQVCDVWLGVLYPNNLDETVANSKNYIFWQNGTVTATYGLTCFPKG